MRIAFAAGGTAGHLYPAIFTAEELRRRYPASSILFLVSRGGEEGDILGDYGFQFEELFVSGIGRPVLYRVVPAAFRMLGAYAKSVRLLREMGAQAVVGFGAYVSVAPVLAAKKLGLKIVLHEQNAVMGRANRCLAPLADSVATSLSTVGRAETGKGYRYTGIPLRPELLKQMDRGEAIDFLGLDRGKFTLLVTGGSQGAHAINRLLMGGAKILADSAELQIVHLAGARDYGEVVKAYARAGLPASVFPYLKQMEWAYAAANLVISRCGAMTLAEIAQAGLPSILIPYPHAVGAHQEANGSIFEEAGAAILRREVALTPEELAGIVLMLKTDAEKLDRMSSAARSLSSPHAAEKLVDVIEDTLKT